MDNNKRTWRKLLKKLQRKRKRQKLARKRDKQEEEDNLDKLKDPLYKSWLEHQDELERYQQLTDEKERHEQEELWQRRELLAQKQFKKDELKRRAAEAEIEAKRLEQEKALKQQMEAQEKKREELRLQSEMVAKEFDETMECMQKYLEDSAMKTPPRLKNCVETRPGEKSCDFFDKTNCCRFGLGCSFNHKRPMLAKILVLRHFFQHPLLERQEHEEYARSDSVLELNEHDLRESYDEFCADVWPVLEEFGTIVNFRAVRNTKAHLRGHIFVEYEEKRSALKAFINLQNRYYASKRLNVEFSNLHHFRPGVCGLSLGRKCEKGLDCNFFHVMKNANNKYSTSLDAERTIRKARSGSKNQQKTSLLSWTNENSLKSQGVRSRTWRWSVSPEIELKSCNTKDIQTNNRSSPNESIETIFETQRNPDNHKSHPSSSQSKVHKSNCDNSNKRSSSRKLRSVSPSHHHKDVTASSAKKSNKTERHRSHKKTREKSPISRHINHTFKSSSQEHKSKSKRHH